MASWHKTNGVYKLPLLRDPSISDGPLVSSLHKKRNILLQNLLKKEAEAHDIPLDTTSFPRMNIGFTYITDQEVEKAMFKAGTTTPGEDDIPSAVVRVG